jgi:hypothetical protein
MPFGLLVSLLKNLEVGGFRILADDLWGYRDGVGM